MAMLVARALGKALKRTGQDGRVEGRLGEMLDGP